MVGGIAKYVIVTPDLTSRTQDITRAIIGTVIYFADAIANTTAFVSFLTTVGTVSRTTWPTDGGNEAHECENEDELERDHVQGENVHGVSRLKRAAPECTRAGESYIRCGKMFSHK